MRYNTRDVERLLELAEAVIKSAVYPNTPSGHAQVDAKALQSLEDWIVNRFEED